MNLKLRTALALAAACLAAALGACTLHRRAKPPETGLLVLRFLEKPNAHGPSTHARGEDIVHFDQVGAFDQHDTTATVEFAGLLAQLREGDVIAYRMTLDEADRRVWTGHLNAVGYQLLRYGHLAMVVQDEKHPEQLVMFSSESFLGPNTQETIATLRHHDWDLYRLDQWERVDTKRLHEFIRLVEARAGHWYGYDFAGMFGLWNQNLTPLDYRKIGNAYICSTVVEAALYYSGVELDAVRNGGYLDICTPLQVVSSKGRLVKRPSVQLVAQDEVTSKTYKLKSQAFGGGSR